MKNSYCFIEKESKKVKIAFSEADADGFFIDVFAYLVEIRDREREKENSFLDHNIFPVASLWSHFQFPGAVLGSKARVNSSQQTQYGVFFLRLQV